MVAGNDMNESSQVAFSQIDITPKFQVELIGCHKEDKKEIEQRV
jgi:hypothetical protein